MKKLIVAVVILAVIIVMALRGCPRARRSAGVAHNPAITSVTGTLPSLYFETFMWYFLSNEKISPAGDRSISLCRTE